MAANPYANLPDRQFWRRAMSRVEHFEVDPVANVKFTIRPSDRVATAGSCFAQHISRSLQRSGFNYWVTEAPPNEMSPEEARRLNYGVFSCRYGNLYTACQLLQLFSEAFGSRAPVEGTWTRDDGRHVDPFRPQIDPGGFASEADVRNARQTHLLMVRKMFVELDVLIFTLGLTEAWRSRTDGSVFPLAPGVAGGIYDPARYEFVNFSVRDVQHDLEEFLGRLFAVNERARVVLTVSPVPLIATYEPRHVLVSTTYSKSVLRVAAQEIVDQFDRVDYFPSYEIVTGNHARGRYFENDLREVSAPGVAHAMRVFMRHYAAAAGTSDRQPELHRAPVPAESRRVPQINALPEDDEIICDEETIEQVRS